MNAATAKRDLRRALRAQRRVLSSSAQRLAARNLAHRLLRQPWFNRAHRIAFYLAADGEIDPMPLLRRALALRKQVYLPVLRPGGRLQFGEFKPAARLCRNRFGVGEPLAGGRCRDLGQLDLVLLPLVAFDRAGGRLGLGGGFFDRSFARRRANKPRLVGVAHYFQEVPELSLESWDVKMAAVATDREWIQAKRLGRR